MVRFPRIFHLFPVLRTCIDMVHVELDELRHLPQQVDVVFEFLLLPVLQMRLFAGPADESCEHDAGLVILPRHGDVLFHAPSPGDLAANSHFQKGLVHALIVSILNLLPTVLGDVRRERHGNDLYRRVCLVVKDGSDGRLGVVDEGVAGNDGDQRVLNRGKGPI
jgi:hypothetical protein